jgi:hypothetical protein
VTQWTSHPPQEPKTRVRIPPGYKVFMENVGMLLSIIDFICIVCVLEKRNKGIGQNIFIKIILLSIMSNNFRKIVIFCFIWLIICE